MRYLILILLFLLLLSPVIAQEVDLPTYSEDDIFTENFTVIEREPIIRAVEAIREIYYLNPDTAVWQSFPYPEDYSTIYTLAPYQGDTRHYIVLEERAYPGITGLILDVQTGTYSEQVLPCGQYELGTVSLNWIYVGESLCNRQTGEIIPLPAEIVEINRAVFEENPELENNLCYEYFTGTRLLPDMRTILIPVCTYDVQYLYRYDAETLEYSKLLELSGINVIRHISSVDNRILYVSGYKLGTNRTDNESSLYRIDLETGETELILETLTFFTLAGEFESEDRRFHAIRLNNETLEFYSYNFLTETLQEHGIMPCEDLPIDCANLRNFQTNSLDGEYFVLFGEIQAERLLAQSFIISRDGLRLIYSTEQRPVFTVRRYSMTEDSFFQMYSVDSSDIPSMTIYNFEGDEMIDETTIQRAENYSSDLRYVLYWGEESKDQLFALDRETGDKLLLMELPSETRAFALFRSDGTVQVMLYDDVFPHVLAIWRAEITANSEANE